MTKFRKLYYFVRDCNHPFVFPRDRQVGHTTRLINQYIQTLFKRGGLRCHNSIDFGRMHQGTRNAGMMVCDHNDFKSSHKRLFKMVQRRLWMEHDDTAEFDMSPSHIKLKSFRHDKQGWTTRLADKYIEDLFEYGTIHPVDHNGETDRLINIIMTRLQQEHGHIFDNIRLENGTIEFLKYYNLKSITYNLTR